MGSGTRPQEDLNAVLSALMVLDHEESCLCAAAIERLDDEDDKVELRRFKGEHERHAARLAPLMNLNVTPHERSSTSSNNKRWRLIIAGLLGDKMILEALKHDEDGARRAYLAALGRGLPPEVRPIIEENLRDELRHSAWIEERLLRAGARSA